MIEKGAWVPAALVLTAEIVSFVAGVIAGFVWVPFGEDHPEWTWHNYLALGLVLFAALGLLAAFGITKLTQAARSAAVEEKNAEKLTADENIQEAVIPTMRSLAKLASRPSDQRAEQFSKTINNVMMSRPLLFPKKNTRMIIYQVVDERNKSRRLESVDFYGRRANKPRGFKDKDRGRGQRVFEWLDADDAQPRFIPDVRQEPDFDTTEANGYLTYISVPIVSDGTVRGMLSVDAPDSGDLDETDIPMLEVLAYALATAFVLRQR
ncbi:GAF domain-containing protein [Pseudoclavibacter sp. AY1H1]|uniref:GAF domain-containing protein n=1 Tax=Pseudoclavibacter sp. AY1H1 TaxID=2080584 RepID=UPI000CE87111|nr:GAF domain-containing protein [Pseudoclavibacter sp. AY1H1]PPF39815.1 hypothetical protein C5E05_00945 [Pseudoclavibacter sp. AY1H1]